MLAPGEELKLDKVSVLSECFELIRVLGEGSFGKVYLIRNRSTRKQYALKRYNRSYLQKRDKYKMLVRSILILKALNHQSVVRFINYIITPDEATIYLLFQASKRGNLQKLKPALRKHKDPQLIRFILYQLAVSLSYLRSKNIAHRDLKPSNITFNSQGQLKLIDFDEAVCFNKEYMRSSQDRLLSDFGISFKDALTFFGSHKSRASNYVGTYAYMSPEMVHSTIGDECGDLWAYACIFYELFVGNFLHIQFDSPQKFEEQLKQRLQTFSLVSDPEALQLFRLIACFSPKDRLDIDQVIAHNYFKNIRNQEYNKKCQEKLSRMLRGNHSIMPKCSLEICEIQIVPMPIGKQIFEQLRTVILLRDKDNYEFCNIYGGPQYFKIQKINNSNIKFYIYYEGIERFTIENQQIVVDYKWDRQQKIRIKHLYPEMLPRLAKLFQQILDD